MAKAFVKDAAGREVECAVYADQDLGDSWAVSVVPPRDARGEQPVGTLVVKLQGSTPEAITKGALEMLLRDGKITRYEE